jgi:hypothetical protein
MREQGRLGTSFVNTLPLCRGLTGIPYWVIRHTRFASSTLSNRLCGQFSIIPFLLFNYVQAGSHGRSGCSMGLSEEHMVCLVRQAHVYRDLYEH